MTAFDRVWRVTVGTLRVGKPLRVVFEIDKALGVQPNKATLSIYNLTRDHQAAIEEAAFAQVVIDAGFANERGAEELFRGELFRAHPAGHGFHQRETRTSHTHVDAITSLQARDGGRAYQRARVERSFGRGVGVGLVLRTLAEALGVGLGNVDEVARLAELEAGGSTLPEGTVLSGPAARELTRFLAGLGLTWSVQHGALQILRRGQPLQVQAVRLSPTTGLIGSPERGTHGRVKALALLTPDLWPGRVVLLESERVNGRYRVHSVKYRGDSHANDWYAETELAAA